MVAPLRQARDKADRPESRTPCGFAREMPICFVALLGIVVAPETAARGDPVRGSGSEGHRTNRATDSSIPLCGRIPDGAPCFALRGLATTCVARLPYEHF
jgi:hypothetical protein